MKSRGRVACLIALALVCSVDGSALQKKKKEEKKDQAVHHSVHWTYEGAEGPEHWGALSPEWERCGSGMQQSPIDLTGAASADIANITFTYGATKGEIVNNGHTIQVNLEPGNSIEVDGKKYELLQFHFHAPSEHAINGKLSPAELHLVHKSADGTLAVVGLMIDKGSRNETLAPVFKNMPAKTDGRGKLDGKINLANLLPAVRTTYRYDGSLTTPPCSEGVKWHVVTAPIAISEDQLEEFERIHDHSNRPVQGLHERKLTLDSTP